MTDIVERIRSVADEWDEVSALHLNAPCDMLREAAIEIERLRATITQLRAVSGAVSVEGHSYADIKKGLRIPNLKPEEVGVTLGDGIALTSISHPGWPEDTQ
jgi:hypothetical protein